MCDICRVFKLCHACNRNPLDNIGYTIVIDKSNKKETIEIRNNVLKYLEEYNSSSDWHKNRFSLEACFCTSCSKEIAVRRFYETKGRVYMRNNINLMQVTFDNILEFPIVKTHYSDHVTFGRYNTTIRPVWFEDDTGQIWFCRSTMGGGRYQKIKKTKKEVLKEEKSC